MVALLALTAIVSITASKEAKAYNPMVVLKYDASVTDNALNAFGTTYDQYIPLSIKMAFESEGGKVFVIPHDVVDSRVDLSGWSGGTLSNVTGYLDPNGGFPAVYVNSKTVDNSNRYNPGTYNKVLVHELGHYVCLESNKIRRGSYSYTFSPQMQAAFSAEYNGYTKTPGMQAVLVSSFQRNASLSEYYANVFAAMILDPANAQAAFPISCACINEDIAVINSKFAPAIQQSQQAAALQALEAQNAQLIAAKQAQAAAEAQAVQILKAQAAQTQDPALALAAQQQLNLYYAMKNQK